MSENLRRGRQARNFTKNVPKILDLKSSSEEIFFRKLSLGAPVYFMYLIKVFDFQSQELFFFTFVMGFWGIENERKAHCQLITKSDNLKKFIVQVT